MVTPLFLPLLLSTAMAPQGSGPGYLAVPAPTKHGGTYHVATQTWSRGGGGSLGPSNSNVLYANLESLGYVLVLGEQEVITDEGRLPGAGQPLVPGQPEVGTSDQYLITGFEISFCATTGIPPTIELSWLEQYVSCTDPTGIPEVATLELTGLPASGCWVVAIDLTDTPSAFDLAADGGDGFDGNFQLDNFGWRFSVDADQGPGTPGFAGVQLAGNPGLDNEGCGTIFKDQGCTGVHGLGSQQQLHIDSPGPVAPCQTGFPIHNAYLRLFGEESAASQAFCNAGANSLSAGGARLSAVAGFGSSQASLQVTNVPAGQPGIFFSGPTAIQLPFGCGTRCVGGAPSVRYGPFLPMNNTVEAQLDMSISPNPNLQFWYRDPDNMGACGNSFNLSDALGS